MIARNRLSGGQTYFVMFGLGGQYQPKSRPILVCIRLKLDRGLLVEKVKARMMG